MASMKRICVFCGSNKGVRPVFASAAHKLAVLLAERQLELVYGAGNVGLMGEIADAVLAAGGKVIGVIPQLLVDKEVAHRGLSDLRIVNTMHERKALMAELSDGFIAMPGGFGTFEEFCEIVTWGQLGLHRKPSALLNVDGYYDPLLALFDHGVSEGFLRPVHRSLVISNSDPEALLEQMESFVPQDLPKWISPAQG